uniref:Uncharacterized protein n=1 Tax=Anopheles albimanus TaxID=7167 RepID=A0A182FX27_ANOAL
MANVSAIATICGMVFGALLFAGRLWMENRHQARQIEYQPQRPSTSNPGPNSTVRRGTCELCAEQGAPIRPCQHAFHDSCYAICGNRCGICPQDPVNEFTQSNEALQ